MDSTHNASPMNVDELRTAIAKRITEKKPLVLSMLAREYGVTELHAARALPAAMRRFAPGGKFDAVWTELSTWASATFIMQHLGTVLEVKGAIPQGSHGHGYFNLKGGSGIGGHLKVDDMGPICFMAMPFMGLDSLSVQFFNAEGAVKFAVYAGRDEKRNILPAVRDSFEALRSAVCEEEA